MNRAERESLKRQRVGEIMSYAPPPTAPIYAKMLKGFLHKDSIEQKEAIFKCVEPLVTKLRRCANCETQSERKFWCEYLCMLIRDFKWVPEFQLDQQVQIKGTIARVMPYRVDFLNSATKTIVEINGGIHDNQRPYDRQRTEKLNELGYTVVSFTNDEIDSDCCACCREVLNIIERRLNLT